MGKKKAFPNLKGNNPPFAARYSWLLPKHYGHCPWIIHPLHPNPEKQSIGWKIITERCFERGSERYQMQGWRKTSGTLTTEWL